MDEICTSRTVMVTGAASGIGKASALRFARAGDRVFLFDCDEAGLARVIAQDFVGCPVAGFHGDVTLKADVEAGVAACETAFGPIDVLVANAGGLAPMPFLEITESGWDQQLAVNLKGAFLCGQAVARRMVDANRPGCIVNVSCMRAELVGPNMAPYAAAKAGVKALTKAMAVELAPHNIRVNAVQPGRTLTEGALHFFADPERRKRVESLVPLQRLAEPDEIAAVIFFLASDAASYLTGASIPIDGGYTAHKI